MCGKAHLPAGGRLLTAGLCQAQPDWGWHWKLAPHTGVFKRWTRSLACVDPRPLPRTPSPVPLPGPLGMFSRYVQPPLAA